MAHCIKRGCMNVKISRLFTGIALVMLGAYIVFGVLVISKILTFPLQVVTTANVIAAFVIAGVGLSRWISKPGKSAKEIWIVTLSALIFALPILLLLLRW